MNTDLHSDKFYSTFSVLIVDDEEPARRSLRLLLGADGDVVEIAEAANGRDALQCLRAEKNNRAGGIDILFLDIQMPAMTGFDVVAAIHDEGMYEAVLPPAIVFVTAYDHYALRAFEASAVDYVLKPFDDERFAEALARAKQRRREQRLSAETERLMRYVADNPLFEGSLFGNAGVDNVELNHAELSPAAMASKSGLSNSASSAYSQRLALSSRNRTIVVDVADIDWIEAESYYASIHAAGKQYLMRETMTNLEARLNPIHFQRIHRSAIVNLKAVHEIRSLPHGDALVLLRDGTELKLSRTRKQAFMMAL